MARYLLQAHAMYGFPFRILDGNKPGAYPADRTIALFTSEEVAQAALKTLEEQEVAARKAQDEIDAQRYLTTDLRIIHRDPGVD